MLLKESVADYLVTLPHTVSDLLVGLESSDAQEVAYEASILKNQAEKCDAQMLRECADKMEQVAIAGDLDTARSLIPELHEYLRQALLLLQGSENYAS